MLCSNNICTSDTVICLTNFLNIKFILVSSFVFMYVVFAVRLAVRVK